MLRTFQRTPMADATEVENAGNPVQEYLSKLEHKPKLTLSHDIGAGSACLKCQCPGLDLHYWRKLCKVCACRADEHDIELPNTHEYGGLAHRKLNGHPGRLDSDKLSSLDQAFRSRNEQNISTHESNRHRISNNETASISTDAESKEELQSRNEFEWTPTEDVELLRKYIQALPEDERPIRGTKGVLKRRQRLQYQLPAYDCYPDKAVSVQTEEVREELEKFVRKAQENVAMGQVVHTDESSANRLTCRECRSSISNDSVGILPSKAHANKTDIWHPGCFKCEQCHDLLADLLYFFQRRAILVWSTFLRENLILDKQYTRAEDRSWHIQHFCCFGCDKHFMNEDYVSKHGQFYCLECYLQKFAKTCLGCGSKIGAPEPYVTHNELTWHKRPACFRCRKCGKFLESKFLLKHQNTFCSDRCKKEFEKCQLINFNVQQKLRRRFIGQFVANQPMNGGVREQQILPG
ncbi:hypothetical protein M3Y98_00791500 [Aphelenchoides besseyi]|nr:hypothetical protein M3Y98_00791500 [Aphelenchoides besseyi]